MVEDDPLARRVVLRVLRRRRLLGDALEARTLVEGLDAMERGQPTAAIVDLQLPDGSGLSLVRELKEAFPLMPAMVLTSVLEADVANQVQRLRAEYVVKPPSEENLSVFMQDAVWVERLQQRQLGRCVALFARHNGLQGREVQVLELALRGVGRDEMAVQFGTSVGTVKSQIRRLLHKTGYRSLPDVGRAVLAQSLSLTPREDV